MAYNYAYQGPEQGVAKAAITNVPLSTKTAVMVAQFLRGKSVKRAQRDLKEVLTYEQAVPFTRFSEGAGHKTKIGPGKFPQKAAEHFLKLVNSVEANAQDQGMGEDLVIVGCTAQQGARGYSYGRWRGRKTKNSHIEMVVAEEEQ